MSMGRSRNQLAVLLFMYNRSFTDFVVKLHLELPPEIITDRKIFFFKCSIFQDSK